MKRNYSRTREGSMEKLDKEKCRAHNNCLVVEGRGRGVNTVSGIQRTSSWRGEEGEKI
jgi:hypothetical protein